VVAAAYLEDVKRKIVDLRRMQRVLTETVARCDGRRGSRCTMIEARSMDNEAQIARGG
jgi:MerR family mercuric resistance operon transcriptional regulator